VRRLLSLINLVQSLPFLTRRQKVAFSPAPSQDAYQAAQTFFNWVRIVDNPGLYRQIAAYFREEHPNLLRNRAFASIPVTMYLTVVRSACERRDCGYRCQPCAACARRAFVAPRWVLAVEWCRIADN
jgi:hypothetical protein